MRPRAALAAASLIAGAAAVLIVPNGARDARRAQAQERVSRLLGTAPLPDLRQQQQQQRPLASQGGESSLPGSSPKPRFTVREQDESLCRAGSRQWTGWVDVSEEKSLFYCR